jgi:nucleoside-diphosphate-sugar epimerase
MTIADLLVLGLGYSARPLAGEVAHEGMKVVGTTRDEDKADELASEGITPLIWGGEEALPTETVGPQTAIIVSTPPDDNGCPSLRSMRQDAAPRLVLYLSSSGVYGDHGGAWIDETETPRPGSRRGVARLRAEKGWQEFCAKNGTRLTVCRLAGIYGPGRSAVDSLSGDTPGARAGLSRRVVKPGHVFNRIHRDDIARALKIFLQIDELPPIVNFSDDHPSPSHEPVAFAAELLGIAPPPLQRFEDIEGELSPMARSFYAENKRLRNDRLKAVTGPLLYPSYRDGLRAIAEGKQGQPR